MTRWNIDNAHSAAQFAVRHMMVTTVKGSFTNISGTLDYDENAPEDSKIEATIDVSTVTTRDAQRDGHLKSPDFFDVENFPSMTFVSKKVTMHSKNTASVIGDLTVRGTTHEVTFEVEHLGTHPSNFGDIRAGFEGKAKIKREDFGLVWNVALEAGGVLVGSDVTISVDLEAIYKAETALA